jgi:fatty acid/phospholipid biosynthesis enzyme
MVDPINIKGRSVSVGRTDVVVTDPALANALMKNPTSVLTEVQKVLGASVSLNDIEIDHNGALVISNPDLARVVKSRLTGSGSAFDVNVICGLRCSTPDLGRRGDIESPRLGD